MLDIVWISKPILALGLIASAGQLLAEVPARVVSVNLCTDQLAMRLAPPSQLVAITYLAREDISSPMAKEAREYNVHYNQVEDIVTLKPDLVLAHSWTSPVLLSMLAEFDIPVEVFETPATLDDIPAYFEKMGALLGHEDEAEKLAQDFQQRLEALDEQARQNPERFTITPYGPNGWISGTNDLSAHVMKRAGFDLLADRYGLEWGGNMPLETLVTARPDLILTSKLYPASSRGEALLGHEALSSSRVRELESDNVWGCATPYILDGFAEILELKRELAK